MNKNRFDDELKHALRREEPSADFTNRLLARVAQEKEGFCEPAEASWQEQAKRKNGAGKQSLLQKLGALLVLPQLKWATAGALAALLLVSAVGLYRHRQQMELQRQAELSAQISEADGQRAKEQVMFAMRIASAKLDVAQKKVRDTLQQDDGQTVGHQQN
jgi:hypothetical protein